MKVFISFSTKNTETATRILACLESNGVECFFAPRDIQGGQIYAEEIMKAIEYCDKMVVILSTYSNASDHVLREVERAVSLRKPIVCYKLDEVVLSKAMEYFLMATQWVTYKSQESDMELVEAVKCSTTTEDTAYQAAIRQESNATQRKGIQADAQRGVASDKKKGRMTKKMKKDLVRNIIAAVLSTALVISLFMVIANSRKKNAVPDYQVGDTITFGSYLDEPISWRIIRINDDGTAVLLASDIITFRCFDAAESGRDAYTFDGRQYTSGALMSGQDQIEYGGNANWAESNLRTWLNATTEVVNYEDQSPIAAAMSSGDNAYANESGFLFNFTEEEIACLVLTHNTSYRYVIDEDALWTVAETEYWDESVSTLEIIDTEDYVYVLSVAELDWVKQAGISIYASPTDAAIAQNQGPSYESECETYNLTTTNWWLRDSLTNSPNRVFTVSNGYTEDETEDFYACADEIGVRPAITVTLSELPVVETEE